ncbi:hypothetical protein CH371_17155 [Leptospira wolffii]|uniref:Lipoprotein n=2 Tax=Leptospira wolffii TaxID=409998 RepID=A0A2M9Z7Z2_9LEPT|nr:hypothetical protein CH371_17155 [Leptospira wolffii]
MQRKILSLSAKVWQFPCRMFFERMKKFLPEMWRFFVLSILIFPIGDCVLFRKGERNPYAELYAVLPISQSKNYVGLENADWESRILSLDEDAKNYVTALNRIDGFEESPSPSSLYPKFRKDLIAAVKAMPSPVLNLMKKKLVRIYVCEELGGSAVTGMVREKDKVIGGFVILDAKTLDKKANEWITFKENSIYKKEETRIRMEIESSKDNTRQNAIRYILLHEFGHILSETENIGPNSLQDYRSFSGYPFFHNIWITEKDAESDRTEFPIRPKIQFYRNSVSLEEEWRNIYPILENSVYPTLYAANNADDFFAESFVSYVHVILEKKPWKLQVIRKNKILFEMGNGIEKPTLDKQRERIGRIFSRYDLP